ncbi:MAG: hypothetical protein ABR587_10585, partial [Candidatus Binatia bacterium]
MNVSVVVVLALLLWLPGALLHRGFAIARAGWGTGRFALEAALSLGFLSLLWLPLYLAGARVVVIAAATVIAIAVLAAAAFLASRRRTQLSRGVSLLPDDFDGEGPRAAAAGDARARTGFWDGASALEIFAFVVAVALLLPVTLAHSGAKVDDWWDLSFVSGWLADGHVGFAQMALSPDPDTRSSPVHPRFLWSVWLMMQAVVALVTGEPAWRVQAGALAAATVVLVVSSQAALARALFRASPHLAGLAAATVAMSAAWIWGTEALPLFVRGYQDKLFAAFVLAPVLLALVVRSASGEADEEPGDGRRERLAWASAVGAAAVAIVSVHSLVFTMSLVTCTAALLAIHGRGVLAWLRGQGWLAAALVLPALYPIGQALALSVVFDDQGVSLASRDNPVVRAHLSLNRLIGAAGWAWIVHPGAVFGSVALAAAVPMAIAWSRRRLDPGARVLLATTVLPCALMFVPGIAALAGKLWVPWMLYRVGWMVPMAPLLAYGCVMLAQRARSPLPSIAFVASVAVLSAITGADRLGRGMNEHPGQVDGSPVAAAAAVYEFLAGRDTRAAVLAPPNFSELVPALSGKPVVAFPERGTLVFATDDVRAYERLRDRATFYSSLATPAQRDALALHHGVRWAVLPRRQVASGSETSWLWRFGPEALLAARAVDESGQEPCAAGADADDAPRDAASVAAGPESVAPEVAPKVAPKITEAAGSCRNWWSATRASVAGRLSPAWTIVFETRDYFVAEYRTGVAAPRASVDDAALRAASPFANAVAPSGAGTAERAAESAASPAVNTAAASPTAGRLESPFALPPWLRPFALTPPAAPPAMDHLLATATDLPGAVVHYAPAPRFTAPSALPVWTEGPGAWEDAPAEATITLDIGVECRVYALEVVPHLPRERRDVLELRTGERVVRAAAAHGRGILVPVDDSRLRRRVTLHAASLIGNPVSLADVRVLGDRTSCGPTWPVHRKPRSPSLLTTDEALIALVTTLPPGGRALVALARRASRDRGNETPVALLAEATRRQPSLLEGWIDLGFARDELAAAASTPEQAASARAAARAAFGAAVAVDSNSSWARGCVAWAEQRSGRPLLAIWHA